MTAAAPLRISILGAAGAMGSLFAQTLTQSHHRVLGFDINKPANPADFETFRVGDIMHPSPQTLDAWRQSDIILISLPHEPAMAAIRQLVPGASPKMLVVDTLSVKMPVIDVLKPLKVECEYLSINPMFAPSLGFANQKVVAIPIRPGASSSAFIAVMESWGATVEQRTAEQHDRECAVMQVATHVMLLCLGKTISESGLNIPDLLKIAPPPHVLSLSLLARILSAAPETYWDIQRDNPYATEIRQQFAKALSDLDAVVQSGDVGAFRAALASMRKTLEPQLPQLTKQAADAIRALTPK